MPLMAPSTYIWTFIELAQQSNQPLQPDELDYSEKAGGFQCGSCRHSAAYGAETGHCALLHRTVHLQEGCCVAWAYNPETLTEVETT